MNKVQVSEFKAKLFAARLESVDCPMLPCVFERVRFGSLEFAFKLVSIPKSTSTKDVVKFDTHCDVDVNLINSYINDPFYRERLISNRLFSIGLSAGRVFLFWCLLNRLIKLNLK